MSYKTLPSYNTTDHVISLRDATVRYHEKSDLIQYSNSYQVESGSRNIEPNTRIKMPMKVTTSKKRFKNTRSQALIDGSFNTGPRTSSPL